MPDGFRTTRLRGIEGRLVPYEWPWARDNAERIAAHWERRRAARPALFDGIVLLSCACTVEGGVARVDLFEARFSQFVAYRDGGAFDGAVANAFAAIVPWGADGAVLVGEMGAHTANAGQLYFPCGTPDRDDLRGETVDLAAARRGNSPRRPGCRCRTTRRGSGSSSTGRGSSPSCAPCASPRRARPCARGPRPTAAAEADPELAALRLLRGPADLDPQRMPASCGSIWRRAFG